MVTRVSDITTCNHGNRISNDLSILHHVHWHGLQLNLLRHDHILHICLIVHVHLLWDLIRHVSIPCLLHVLWDFIFYGPLAATCTTSQGG